MNDYKYKVVESSLFKKTLKLAKKRGLDITLLQEPIRLLARGEALPPKYRDHQLKGRLKHLRECHVQGDWLLVYRIIRNSRQFSYHATPW